MKSDELKETIRKRVKEQLQKFPENSKVQSERIIQSSLFSVSEFQRANVVSVYYAKNSEVNTLGIFRELWENRKNIVLAPRIHGDNIEMCQVYSVDDFVEGVYGLKEPSQNSRIYTGAIDVAIVPGLAFDGLGTRLGRGKGYYDTFLKQNHTCPIGLAFDFQILSHLPKTLNDVSMNYVVSEKRIIRNGKI